MYAGDVTDMNTLCLTFASEAVNTSGITINTDVCWWCDTLDRYALLTLMCAGDVTGQMMWQDI